MSEFSLQQDFEYAVFSTGVITYLPSKKWCVGYDVKLHLMVRFCCISSYVEIIEENTKIRFNDILFLVRENQAFISSCNYVIYSHNKYAYIHIYRFMQDTYWRNKLIRPSNKRRRKTSLTKYLSLTLLQGFEKVVWGFTVRGSWRSNITAIFWPQTYGRHVVSFLFFDAQPEPWGPLYWVLAFFTVSYQHLLWTPNSIGVPRAPSAGCGFPYYISSPTSSDFQLNSLVELNCVI